MSKREFTCIGCPMGCALQVEIENGCIISVTGNTCKRGEEYAKRMYQSYKNSNIFCES